MRKREFLFKAARSNTDRCILWPFSLDTCGYGRVSFLGYGTSAHRVSLMLAEGVPPKDGMQAAHDDAVCRSRACVNPRHLRWATVKENAADRSAKREYAIRKGVSYCQQCGEPYEARQYRIAKGITKFCSRECSSKHTGLKAAKKRNAELKALRAQVKSLTEQLNQ